MTLAPFRELLKKTKSQIDEMLIPTRVKQAKLKGETELASIEEKILMAEVEIQELCVVSPIDYTKLMTKLDDVALLERRMKQLTKIMEELFSTEDVKKK